MPVLKTDELVSSALIKETRDNVVFPQDNLYRPLDGFMIISCFLKIIYRDPKIAT